MLLTGQNGVLNLLLINWVKGKKCINDLGIDGIDVVFEHIGAETLGFSVYTLNRGGSVVICAASSGYDVTIDLRYLWMELKKIIGSHFANYNEAKEAAELVFNKKITPLIYNSSPISDINIMLDKMYGGNTFGKIVFYH